MIHIVSELKDFFCNAGAKVSRNLPESDETYMVK